MSRRITISIPDELHESMQEVKSELNISGIAAKAIAHQVAIEKLRQNALTTDDLIERIKMEQEQEAKEWKRIGVEVGAKEALLFSLKQFRIIKSGTKPYEMDLQWWNRQIEKNGLPDEETAIESFSDGFVEGVLAIWDKVKAF